MEKRGIIDEHTPQPEAPGTPIRQAPTTKEAADKIEDCAASRLVEEAARLTRRPIKP